MVVVEFVALFFVDTMLPNIKLLRCFSSRAGSGGGRFPHGSKTVWDHPKQAQGYSYTNNKNNNYKYMVVMLICKNAGGILIVLSLLVSPF